MSADTNGGNDGAGEDPLEKRPAGDHGDTAVPREGDIAQEPQTVEDDFTPSS